MLFMSSWWGVFGRIVNPIPTGEGRLSPPITTGTPNVFHLPASLYLSKNSKKSKRKEWQAWSVITIDRVAWYQILLSSLCARLATLDDFGTVSKPCQPVWRGVCGVAHGWRKLPCTPERRERDCCYHRSSGCPRAVKCSWVTVLAKAFLALLIEL